MISCRRNSSIARWLEQRAGVVHVRHPAFADCPGHAFWRHDFTGANGLVSFVTEPASHEGVTALLDGMRLFGLGASWGGYESLIIPFDPQPIRTATRRWPHNGPCFRLHCGLEDLSDLIEDLDDGLKRLQARA